MRRALPLLLGSILLVSTGVHAQSPIDSTETMSNPLIGTWEMISQKIISADTTVDRTATLGRRIKILNDTHFAFGWMVNVDDDDEEVYGGGGRYTYDGDHYTEHIEFHSSTPLIGQSIAFEARIEDDLWYHRGRIGESMLEEVWRRVTTPTEAQ